MRRPRGPGGRFLTASEIAELRTHESLHEHSQGDGIEDISEGGEDLLHGN